ncbi:MAG: hypothetical protein ACRD1T_27935, partial [Acidimicrobiia bacterium]
CRPLATIGEAAGFDVWRDVKNLWAPVLDALMSFLLDEEAHPEANTALHKGAPVALDGGWRFRLSELSQIARLRGRTPCRASPNGLPLVGVGIVAALVSIALQVE